MWLSVDPLTGLVLSVDNLPAEDAHLPQTWLAPIATAVGPQLLVSDDADGSKTADVRLGFDRRVFHTEALVESLIPRLRAAKSGWPPNET